tara:strand:- start:293 stop:928 length:636 start_codon:yes stop_codon:yes gene_type:complete
MSAMIFPIFSKPIYRQRLRVSSANLKPVLEFLHENNFPTVENSTILDIGQKTNYVLEADRFKVLKDAIIKEFNLFANNELKHTCDWQITTSFFVRLDNGEEESFDVCNNSLYSGIYDLEAKENCGNLTFVNFTDRRLTTTHSEYNLLNARKWSIEPKTENVIFFPSEVYHRLEQNLSGNVRYSLAFNIMPKGTIQEDGLSDTIITLGNVNE